MLGYFSNKLETLLDIILQPLWQRLLSASLATKVGVLLAVACGVTVASNPEPFKDYASQSINMVRVVGADSGIPISQGTLHSTRSAANRIALTSHAGLLDLNPLTHTPWSVSQGVVALISTPKFELDEAAIVRFIRTHKASGCSCWAELPESPADPATTFISGWVMTALASMQTQVAPDELQFVFDSQNADGSWSIFSLAEQPAFESTYATSWMLLGLHAQRTAGLISGQDAERADAAIARAVGWLLSHRNTPSRWKAYPLMSGTNGNKESLSISGLALHALHAADPGHLSELDVSWIESLPKDPVAPADTELFYVEIDGPSRRAIDHFAQIKLPWMLIATADAFASGNALQRARALSWIEKTLNQRTLVEADTSGADWWRAELLYSMQYTLARTRS